MRTGNSSNKAAAQQLKERLLKRRRNESDDSEAKDAAATCKLEVSVLRDASDYVEIVARLPHSHSMVNVRCFCIINCNRDTAMKLNAMYI